MALENLGYFLALALDITWIFYILFRGSKPDAKNTTER